MIFFTYVPLNYLYELAFPPKPTKAAELTPLEEQAAREEAAAAAKARALEGKGEPAIDLEAEIGENESRASEQKPEEKFE